MGLLSALLASILLAVAFFKGYTRQVGRDLRAYADLILAGADNLDDAASFGAYAAEDRRITVISASGEVLYDSASPGLQLENHLLRPEVAAAQRTGEGYAVRRSDTLGRQVHYCAVRMDNGSVLRVSVESALLLPPAGTIAWQLALMLAVLTGLAVLLAVILTRKILKPIYALASDGAGLSAEEGRIYPELRPFVREIRTQRDQILAQMRKLEEEENRLQVIIRHMTEGLVVLDESGRIQLANESAHRLLELPDGCEGTALAEHVASPELLKCLNLQPAQSRTAFVDIGGKQLQVMANNVYAAAGFAGVICFIVDVGEQRQIEKMKQEFTANVSHELKTPLTSISGYAEMIENGMAKEEDIRGFASIIRKEAGRLLTLISDIIQLSELDDPEGAMRLERVDLLELALECEAILALPAEARNITFTVIGGHSYVTGDRGMLSELVYNLCDNAIRYNRDGGSVNVLVRPGELTVRDTGIGIPKEHQDRIFERFYRVDKSRSKQTGGTGLGLAIVKHITERHGARIALSSRAGTGTEITVRFKKE